jgi:hypothetical protein
MTEAAFFVDLETGEIRSKVVRSVAPSIRVRFNTFLKCVIGFVRDEVAEALADGTGVTLVVKPALGHTEAAVALDVTATVTGTGTARRYEMQALVTGDALSDLLNGLDEAVFSLQVAWGTEGAAGYGISEPLEVVIVNAYVRPGDEIPDPTGDAAWELLKDTFPQATPDEVERTLEFDVGGGGGDFLPLAGGTMDENAEIVFENFSKIRETPNGCGIEQVCSNDYIHRWQSGTLYITEQGPNYLIRVAMFGLTSAPGAWADETLGYKVGSRYILDDGTTYICTDATATAAGWDLVPVVGVSAADDVTASSTLAVNTRGIVDVSGATAVELTLPTGATNDVIERRIQIAAGASLTLTIVSGATTLFTYVADGDEAVGWFQFTKHSSGWKATGLNLIGVNTTGGGSGLPASVTFAFDARLLTLADATEIDDTTNIWNADVGSYSAGQSDSTRRPVVAINSSESGTERTVVFDADTGEEDVLILSTAPSLSGPFSLFFKIKTGTIAGLLAVDDPPTAFILGLDVEGSGFKMLFGSGGTLVQSTEAPTLADSNFHILEVHRDGADLVEWFVDDVAYGSDTNAETISFDAICNSLVGNLECVVFCDTRVSAGDRTDILNYLA